MNDHNAMRGVVFGVCFGACFWIAVGAIIYAAVKP